ncbi:hypothetical protein ElyMa_006277100 [Elysia marginata]|uniref:Uncharacterized protein n=1 Tax=Elysia marginata TaxID=1093978 RepID=A0AAV4HBP0_9GAST|nr:hypothetical protein ElyMa_006277100 [Elysia marginata]
MPILFAELLEKFKLKHHKGNVAEAFALTRECKAPGDIECSLQDQIPHGQNLEHKKREINQLQTPLQTIIAEEIKVWDWDGDVEMDRAPSALHEIDINTDMSEGEQTDENNELKRTEIRLSFLDTVYESCTTPPGVFKILRENLTFRLNINFELKEINLG